MTTTDVWRLMEIGALCVIGAALPLAAQDHPHYTRFQLRERMRDAQTPEQCQALARWFREEEAAFQRKAEAREQDYLRFRRQTLPAKFPTPADTAKSLHDYYVYRAHKASVQAARLEAKSASIEAAGRGGSVASEAAHR